MRKLIIFTIPFVTLFVFNTAFAQENLDVVELYNEENIQRLKDEYTKMLQECESGETNELCTKATEVTLQGLKTLAIERLEGSYARTLNMVERIKLTNSLTPEDEAILNETLSAHKSLVDNHSQKVKNAQTIQELHTYAQERITNNELKIELRRLSVRRMKLGYLNIEHFSDQLNAIAQRIEVHIDAAQNIGHDTTEVERHLSLAKEKLLLVQTMYKQNSDLLDSEINGTASADVEDIKEQLIKAKDLLIDAKEDLKSAVAELKILYKAGAWEVE